MMMTDKRAFAAGLTALAEMHQREITKDQMAEYWRLLQDKGSDADFERAVAWGLKAERWPTPAHLMRAMAGEQEARVRAGAVTLFEQVWRTTSYNPHVGTVYRGQKISERCGALAALLFQAAGGVSAFEDTARDVSQTTWVRKAFVEAALDMARTDPEARTALASGDLQAMKALPVACPYQPMLMAPEVLRLARQIGSGQTQKGGSDGPTQG